MSKSVMEITDEMRAAVIAELRAKATELAPAGRDGFPGICGTSQTLVDGKWSDPKPAGLYSEDMTLKCVKEVWLRMLDASQGIERYRPSNGSEGMWFADRFCDNCAKDNLNHQTGEGGCPILANTLLLDLDDEDYPLEWRKDGPDGPRCTAFQARKVDA